MFQSLSQFIQVNWKVQKNEVIVQKDMAPNTTDTVPYPTTLKFKYPKQRSSLWSNGDLWLDDKRNDDNAEGLWRVHDGLYDVSSFIDKHPGGRMWLEITKGTDITEAFECHHLSDKPEYILQKYFVRAAQSPRNSPFTFEDDGFYRTLKKRVMEELKNVPKESIRSSNIMTDLLLLGTFLFAILSVAFWSYTLGFISAAFLACTTIAAHNYCHQKDNFRMYYFNLSMMQFRNWRITHTISHHLFPNTVLDFEISTVEPFFIYLPRKKSWVEKYGSWIYSVVLWLTLFKVMFIRHILRLVYLHETRHIHWSDILPFSLPTVMLLVGGQPLLPTLGMWMYIVSLGSMWFSVVGLTAAHHHPDIFHDGDTPRFTDKIDWGIYQLDAVADRPEINSSQFLTLTNFGEHTLHHFFPTMDHAALKYLHKIVKEVMDEFGLGFRIKSHMELVKGQFMQLAKEEPNRHPPSYK